MSIRSKLGLGGKATAASFTPRSNLPRSDVQSAVEYVMDNAENVGTVYAPTDAEYITSSASSGLSNERVLTDTASITWDFSTLGEAKASFSFLGLQNLTDPGADRIAFWDDSESAFAWLRLGTGLSFVGDYLSITDANLIAVRDTSWAKGDVVFHDGTTLNRLGAGVYGQFLKTQGAGADPTWEYLSGGGDMVRANNLSDLTSASTARTNLGVAIGTNVQAWDASLDSFAALATAADKIAYTTAANTWAETAITTFGRSLIDDADAATARTTLGLVIGTNVQAYDAELAALAGLTSAADSAPYFTGSGTASLMTVTAAARTVLDDTTVGAMLTTLGGQPLDAELTAIAGLTSAADRLPYFTGSGTASLATFTAFGRTLVDDADAATARTTLGLVIGTNVQAFDAELAALAGLTSAADSLPYFTGSGTAALATFTAAGRALVDDADAAAQRTTLGLVIGTNVQAFDAELAAIAGLTSAADRLPYFTGSGTAALATFTAFGRSLVDDADAATARTTLGLTIGTDVQAYNARLADVAALVDPNADRLLFWDDSAGALVYLTLGTNLSITGTTLNATGGGGGSLSDADYGDITVSGGATVFTIDDDVVTFAKMQNIATDRLIGRDTAASGDPEEISVGGGLEFTGTGGIQRSALTGDVTASAGSASTTIANDAVTYAKMQNASANVVLTRADAASGDIGETALAASQLLGRGASGNVAAITLGTNLSMSGTTLNASGGGVGRGAVIASFTRNDMN